MCSCTIWWLKQFLAVKSLYLERSGPKYWRTYSKLLIQLVQRFGGVGVARKQIYLKILNSTEGLHVWNQTTQSSCPLLEVLILDVNSLQRLGTEATDTERGTQMPSLLFIATWGITHFCPRPNSLLTSRSINCNLLSASSKGVK